MRTMDWQPDEEMLTWGRENFLAIPVEGIWSPEDAGVTYKKVKENTFALMMMYNHPDSQQHHERLKVLMGECGYEVLEGDGEMVTPPLNPQSHIEQEFMIKQERARNWLCPDCDYPLANCDLETRDDEYVENVEAELSNGEHADIELWRCTIKCSGCDTDINMDPSDYHLLAGDSSFMRCEINNKTYIGLDRKQLKELADAGVLEGQVIGGKVDGHKVPPWMWGMYCLVLDKSPIFARGEEE